MPAYFRCSITEFLAASDDTVIAKLQTAYASDGYRSQYTTQTIAWATTLPALRREFSDLLRMFPSADTWHLLLEYPLYRLRRRIDAVVLTPDAVVVLELKTGAKSFDSADRRQAEEYAQDLRDFHAASARARLRPVLWALEAEPAPMGAEQDNHPGVSRLLLVGRTGLANTLLHCAGRRAFGSLRQATEFSDRWDKAPYQPVPSVIEAATTLFAGHGVREITLSTAKNLRESASEVLSIIERSRANCEYSVVFLTGVPGAGKTLAGLNVVHAAVRDGIEREGEIVYLSGNTPLVVVLREALARDRYRRASVEGQPIKMGDARASTRATVQHINDFLKEYLNGSGAPPSEHVIVFDEAQRAWNARQGMEKFGRDASEPHLVLETMLRHRDWAVCVCLIGKGQEINDGEEGVAGWAEAISRLSTENVSRWKVYGPDLIFGASRSPETLGQLPDGVETVRSESLHLNVPMRSFRSPTLATWIERVIEGEFSASAETARELSYPLYLTRSLEDAKAWLRQSTLGERRMGLLASSGAKRLRADGLGQVLSATDGQTIAHWYLNSPGDIRSSFALEVPANEYTSQGLEIDFACLCWGGDLIYKDDRWITRSLSGNRWTVLSDSAKRMFVLNSYRVLLSRAREGMVIWVPKGDVEDHTRSPSELDDVADCLLRAGVQRLA